MNKILKIINNFNELVMFKHSIFSLPFIFIAMIVASSGWFGYELLLLGIMATITARNFAMGVNRYIDKSIDIKNPRTKNRPSVDGRIKPSHLLIFIFLNGLLFIITTYFVNITAFNLSLFVLIIIGSYSYFKRFSYLAHLMLGICLGLSPLAGVIAVGNDITPWSVFLAIGVTFWVTGFDILYSLQDIHIDKKLKLHSIPARFGAKKSLKIAQILHTWTILFWFLFAFTSSVGTLVYTAIVLSTLMLIYEHILVNRNMENIDKAFFTVNGYLGIMFLIFIIIDQIILKNIL